MKKNNVDNLVQLSREGDSAAFEILFSTFKSRLHNSLLKFLETFMKPRTLFSSLLFVHGKRSRHLKEIQIFTLGSIE